MKFYEWIKFDGNKRPVSKKVKVEVSLDNQTSYKQISEIINWNNTEREKLGIPKILYYREVEK